MIRIRRYVHNMRVDMYDSTLSGRRATDAAAAAQATLLPFMVRWTAWKGAGETTPYQPQAKKGRSPTPMNYPKCSAEH